MTSHSSERPAYGCLTVAPQIIHDAPLLTIVLPSKPGRLRARIPNPLRPHPAGRLILNMWALSDPRQTTGFGAPGPVGVSYLAAEVVGAEGASNDGAVTFPGRAWLEHWSSSEAARAYGVRAPLIPSGGSSLARMVSPIGLARARFTLRGFHSRPLTARRRSRRCGRGLA